MAVAAMIAWTRPATKRQSDQVRDGECGGGRIDSNRVESRWGGGERGARAEAGEDDDVSRPAMAESDETRCDSRVHRMQW